MTKYQVRIRGVMSDTPASEQFDTKQEAVKKLLEVREELRRTWPTNRPFAYINVSHSTRKA